MEKTLKGKNIEGVERSYTFNLLSAKDGVKLVHQYGSVLITAFPYLKGFFVDIVRSFMGDEPTEKQTESTVEEATTIVQIIPQVLTWERMEDLAKQMMSGGKIDGEKIIESHVDTDKDGNDAVVVDKSESFSSSLDEEGFGDIFQYDITEFYVAIFYAILANYPKYVLPFLDTGSEDTTPDSQKSSTQKQ